MAQGQAGEPMVGRRGRGGASPPDRRYGLLLLVGVLAGTQLGAMVANLPLYVEGRWHDPLISGTVVALPFLAEVVMSSLWGAASDRWGRRALPLAAGLLGGGMLYLALPLVHDPLLLILLRLVQLLLLSVMVLGLALVSELVPSRPGAAQTEVFGSTALGVVVGALVGGWLLQWGFTPVALFAAAAALAAGGLTLLVAKPRRHRATAGWGEVQVMLHRPGLRVMALLLTMLFTANNLAFTTALLYFEKTAVPPLWVGAAYASLVLLGIPLVLFLGRHSDAHGRRDLLRLAPVVYLAQWTVAAAVLQPPVVLLVIAIPAWPFLVAPALGMIADVTTERERGRGSALFATFVALGNVIGAFSAALLLKVRPDHRSALVVAVIVLVGALVVAQSCPETATAAGPGAKDLAPRP